MFPTFGCPKGGEPCRVKMKNMKHKKLFFSIALYAMICFPPFGGRGGLAFSQDIHFSQNSPLLLNPGATGTGEGLFRTSLGYKTQWSSMGNPYRSMVAAFDMPLLKEKKKLGYLGLGGYFFSDKAGDSKLGTTSFNLSLSAIVPLDEQNTLSTGFNFGYGQRSASITNLQWPGQYNGQTYDPGIASNEANLFNSFTFFDMSTGVHYQFLKNNGNIQGKDIFRINAGIAYFHLNQPNQKFYSGAADPLYGKIVLNALGRFDIPQTKIGIVPSMVYVIQGPAREMDLGASIRYKVSEGTKVTGFKTESAISGGVLYRVNDAIIPQLLLEFANFGIGLSYDVNISSLSTATRKASGLEICLKYSNVRDALFQGKK
jgi:type IX secretion system PorP/SprF family membrane protein